MNGGPWNINVPDATGKLHRGTFSWGDDLPDGPLPRKVFHIALRHSPDTVDPPPATAVCIPRFAREAAHLAAAAPPIPDAVKVMIFRQNLMLPAADLAQYRAGSIVTPGGRVDPALIFVEAGGRGRFDIIRLALILVQQVQAERTAPFAAVIRHELALPPGADATGALRARLQPADAASKPPLTAPAVKRLWRALAALESGKSPPITFERLTEDLRFLTLFEAPGKAMKREALDRLLADVRAADPEPPQRRSRRKPAMRPRARIIDLPRREDA